MKQMEADEIVNPADLRKTRAGRRNSQHKNLRVGYLIECLRNSKKQV